MHWQIFHVMPYSCCYKSCNAQQKAFLSPPHLFCSKTTALRRVAPLKQRCACCMSSGTQLSALLLAPWLFIQCFFLSLYFQHLEYSLEPLSYMKIQSMSSLTSPISERFFHSAFRAFLATSSNTGSPVRWLKVANSTIKVPIPAVQVTGVSPGFTPCNKFTVP